MCFSYVNIGNLVRETTLANVVVLLVEFSPLIMSRFLTRFYCVTFSILVD